MNCFPGGGSPRITYDQSGVVFAVGLQSRVIRLFDIKNYENVTSFS